MDFHFWISSSDLGLFRGLRATQRKNVADPGEGGVLRCSRKSAPAASSLPEAQSRTACADPWNASPSMQHRFPSAAMAAHQQGAMDFLNRQEQNENNLRRLGAGLVPLSGSHRITVGSLSRRNSTGAYAGNPPARFCAGGSAMRASPPGMDFSRETGKNMWTAPRRRDARNWVIRSWLGSRHERPDDSCHRLRAVRRRDGQRLVGGGAVAGRLVLRRRARRRAAPALRLRRLRRRIHRRLRAPEARGRADDRAGGDEGHRFRRTDCPQLGGRCDADNRGVAGSAKLWGPALLEATVPANDIARAIRAAGVPARVSTNAGDDVCNHLFDGALSYLFDKAPGTSAVFTHPSGDAGANPAARDQAAARDRHAALALKAAIAAMTNNVATSSPARATRPFVPSDRLAPPGTPLRCCCRRDRGESSVIPRRVAPPRVPGPLVLAACRFRSLSSGRFDPPRRPK